MTPTSDRGRPRRDQLLTLIGHIAAGAAAGAMRALVAWLLGH